MYKLYIRVYIYIYIYTYIRIHTHIIIVITIIQIYASLYYTYTYIKRTSRVKERGKHDSTKQLINKSVIPESTKHGDSMRYPLPTLATR